MGDGMAASFSTAGDAVTAAVAIKSALAKENWRSAAPLRARIGLHTAEVVIVDDGGYARLPINRCARLMTAAHGGQIVISGATESLVCDQLPDGVGLVDLGEHRLRDLGRPLQVFPAQPDRPPRRLPATAELGFVPREPACASQFLPRRCLRGAAYATFGRAASDAGGEKRSGTAPETAHRTDR